MSDDTWQAMCQHARGLELGGGGGGGFTTSGEKNGEKIKERKRGKECKTREFFEKKGKMVIYRNSHGGKSWDFSRSWMTKWISPLELSREI